jgi:AAA domain
VRLAQGFDQSSPPPPLAPRECQSTGTPGDRPGDHFNATADWMRDVLGPAGWAHAGPIAAREGGGGFYVRRPGKDVGHSGTVGFCASDLRGPLLYVFSTNAAPFAPGHGYSKFEAWAVLNHGGDYAAAARALIDSRPAGRIVDRHAPPQAAGGLVRIPASQLRAVPPDEQWLWQGLLPAGHVSIFSALPKAGKTTLLAHLLRALGAGGEFCGQGVKAATVLYCTEESQTIWAGRRDRLGLADHCEFVLRPFRLKPSYQQWVRWIGLLEESLARKPADLVVIDTLTKLWPVTNENDASEVTGALQPLLEIAYGGLERARAPLAKLGPTLLLVHHLRKSDGLESTATRGSGGITASVDSILELRRFRPGDRKDRRRVLCCDSRFEDARDELVLELSADGAAYAAQGDREEVNTRECAGVIEGVLPAAPPGLDYDALVQAGWADGPRPTKAVVLAALAYGLEAGLWQRQGRGTRGAPFTYFLVSPAGL